MRVTLMEPGSAYCVSDSKPVPEAPKACSIEFWNALAPHHAFIEENYFDVQSVHLLMDSLQQPVLVVGAGQGLIVAELQKQGIRCDGIDSSSEMIRYAGLRRGITLIQADARDLPFAPGSYKTVIYATGVIDFIGDDETIRAILNEGRRITTAAGKLFVAFYRLSKHQEQFVARVGLLANHRVQHRQSFETYLLNPREMVAWVAKRAGVSKLRAIAILLSLAVHFRWRELRTTMRMQRIFRDPKVAEALLNAAPSEQPYRNEAEVRNLFQRVGVPIKQLRLSPSCFIVEF